MKEKRVSDLQRNNKTAKVCHTIEAVLITVFYFLQAMVGKRSMSYAIIVAVLALLPVIGEQFFYLKDRETPMIKHLVGFGFAITYTFLIFTATNSIVFVYVIPMILVISIFNDAKYSLEINIGTVVESFIMVIGGALTGKFGYQGTDSAMIQIFIMTLIGIYSIYTAKTSNANNEQKMEAVEEAHSRTELVLTDVSNISKNMQQGMTDIFEKIDKLNQSSIMTKDAMDQVSTGTADTANAVQNQLRQTEEIQAKVDIVSEVADKITENMHQTLQVLENGNKDVELLVRQVEESVNEGADVAEKLETLDQYISEMHSIVELISGITAQTSLLALNASIEAARAGEAGRGFSVVATEISAMATQTKDATVHITGLIENISKAITEVVGVIREMIAGINEEKQSTENTAASFENIQDNTLAIRDNVEHLTDNIEELKTANQEIVESIQTISAISEEVSAHANETLTAQEENSDVLNHITDKVQELIEISKHEI